MAFFVASNEYTLAVRLNYLKRAHIVTALEFRVGEAFVFGHGSHLPVTNPWSSPGAPDLPARPARRHRIRRQERKKKLGPGSEHCEFTGVPGKQNLLHTALRLELVPGVGAQCAGRAIAQQIDDHAAAVFGVVRPYGRMEARRRQGSDNFGGRK